MKIKLYNSKYRLWDNGVLVRAYVQKPRNVPVYELTATTAQERKYGIRWVEVPPSRDKWELRRRGYDIA